MRLAHQARAAPRWPFPAEVREPRGGRQRKWPRSCSLCACAPCPVAAFGAVLCPVFISPREGGARIPSGGRALLTSAALVPLTMAGILFEDIFDVKDIDPEGKKFDRGKVCRGGMREEANMPTQVARPPLGTSLRKQLFVCFHNEKLETAFPIVFSVSGVWVALNFGAGKPLCTFLIPVQRYVLYRAPLSHTALYSSKRWMVPYLFCYLRPCSELPACPPNL